MDYEKPSLRHTHSHMHSQLNDAGVLVSLFLVTLIAVKLVEGC
jgi:hypothetical protein